MKALIEIAESQLGVNERTKNSGPEIDEYLKFVGLGPGFPWCAAFVSWCVDQCKKKGHPTDFKYSAGVLVMWRANAPYRVPAPKPGDVFIMDFGRGKGHTGIVTSVDGNILQTIEGNSNLWGSREGTHVLRGKRDTRNIKGFLRPFLLPILALMMSCSGLTTVTNADGHKQPRKRHQHDFVNYTASRNHYEFWCRDCHQWVPLKQIGSVREIKHIF